MDYQVWEAGLLRGIFQHYKDAAEWCRVRLEQHPLAHASIFFDGVEVASTRSGSLYPSAK